MTDPSTNGGNGRDPQSGRFVKGCAGGPGNPNIKHLAKLRDGFLAACTVADVRAICRKLVAMAKKGNLLAVREVLDRTIGKSVTSSDELSNNEAGKFLPIIEVLVADREEAIEFKILRDAMLRQWQRPGVRVPLTGLLAPEGERGKLSSAETDLD